MESSLNPSEDQRTLQLKRQFQTARVYEATGTAEQLQSDLLEIARLDKHHSEIANRHLAFLIFAVASIVITFGAALLTASSGLGGMLTPVLGLLFIAQIPLVIWLYQQRRKHARLDGEDRRFKVPAKLIRYLSADMDADSELHLKIDFRHYRTGPFQKGATVGGMWRAKSKSRFEVPWLSLKGRLLDGTRFQFEISQLVRRKVKRKRRVTLCSEALSDRYDLALVVKPNRYRNLDQFPKVFPTVKPPVGLTISDVRAITDKLEITAVSANKLRSVSEHDLSDPFPYFSADPALQMFLAAYQCMGKCSVPAN